MISFPYRQLLRRPILSWRSPTPFLRARRPQQAIFLLAVVTLSGCTRLKHKQDSETVYVLSKQSYLRDRVAAVSNRVGTVQNGQRLTLLERGRRFLRVRTDNGETGWIEEHAVVNPEVVTGFEMLRRSREKDSAVGAATLRDDAYLHLEPGRDTDRFYLLPEGDKLQLLARASVPKAVGPQASGSASSFAGRSSSKVAKKPPLKPTATKERPAEKQPAVSFKPAPPPPAPISPISPSPAAAVSSPVTPPVPVPMEDWWLIRDREGKVGWLMARRIDVDVPDEISGYAEGQRMVAAYLLRKVEDPQSNFPDKLAPEYVTVLNPYVDGLAYDFSQVRVFTWNLRKHRYETAFRQRNLQGYLPVTVSGQGIGSAATPTFSFVEAAGDAVAIDPATGATRPSSTVTLTYRLEGSLVKKVEANAPAPAARPAAPNPVPSGASRKSRRAPRGHRRRR